MNIFARRADKGVDGERGVASVDRMRSIQSRVSSVLSIGLMCILGLAALAWYYAHAAARQPRARRSAQAEATRRAEGEMILPSLGRIDPPPTTPTSETDTETNRPHSPATSGAMTVQEVPLLQTVAANSIVAPPYGATAYGSAAAPCAIPEKNPMELALERRLTGAAFTRAEGAGGLLGKTAAVSIAGAADEGPDADPRLHAVNESLPAGDAIRGSGSERRYGGSDRSSLASLLHPESAAAVEARVLPTQQFLLAKGAFIDCTLETAIDSTLPGMTTCITATDTFGVDGKIVLLERGTKLVGETQGQVQQGATRVFVLWTEARTPTGVVVPLTSPGTDELGRSGLPGAVNRHFWERFGAAILVSTVDGAMQAAMQSSNKNGGGVIYNPSASQDVLTEVLKGTINIPPTVVKRNGDRIQVLVARDLDFRRVYDLRTVQDR